MKRWFLCFALCWLLAFVAANDEDSALLEGLMKAVESMEAPAGGAEEQEKPEEPEEPEEADEPEELLEETPGEDEGGEEEEGDDDDNVDVQAAPVKHEGETTVIFQLLDKIEARLRGELVSSAKKLSVTKSTVNSNVAKRAAEDAKKVTVQQKKSSSANVKMAQAEATARIAKNAANSEAQKLVQLRKDVSSADAQRKKDAQKAIAAAEKEKKDADARTMRELEMIEELRCKLHELRGKPVCGWKRVTKEMIKKIDKVGVTCSMSGNPMKVTCNVVNNGCGAPGSGAIFYVGGDWNKIKYTEKFWGTASCNGVFGSMGYHYLSGKSNGLFPLDPNQGDKIWNMHSMSSKSAHVFDGRTTRCDNEADNWWHNRNGGGSRWASVELRRNPTAAMAGFSTGTSCGKPSYEYSDIFVYINKAK